jgi:bacillithiol biosynthesis cysteine-adding enzyme BshC
MKKILKTSLYNRFYYDYLASRAESTGFLSPVRDGSLQEIAQMIDAGSDHYQQVKGIMARQNSDLHSNKAKLHLDQLTKPQSVILITGQQLGLFASPLYTIYKLVTTIKLAESLNDQNNRYHFIPVFWLESEDHDFQEICRVGLLDPYFQPKEVTYQGQDRGKVPMRYYQLESSVRSFISEIRENIAETEFTSDLFDKIIKGYKQGTDWVTASREFLKDIFEDKGLLFFYPGDDEIKNISIDFFKQLLVDNEKYSMAFAEVSQNIVKSGYQNQVKVIPGKTFIHFETEDKKRFHLYRNDRDYYLKDSELKFTLESALEFISGHPIAVSTSVVSRPLLQSWLLPVVAYIAGPAEIAYWAQLGKMFKNFDLVMPQVYPRISATLMEPKIARYLEKNQADVENISFKKKEFIDQYYKNLSNTGADDPVGQLQKELLIKGGEIEAYLKQLDPTLIDSAKKTITRMVQTLENLENRVIKMREQKNSQLTSQLEQIHTAFFPANMPQERFLPIVYFLNKFGPQFVDSLYKNLEVDDFNHQVVYL